MRAPLSTHRYAIGIAGPGLKGPPFRQARFLDAIGRNYILPAAGSAAPGMPLVAALFDLFRDIAGLRWSARRDCRRRRRRFLDSMRENAHQAARRLSASSHYLATAMGAWPIRHLPDALFR